MNLNVAAPIQQAAARLRTRRGAICASPAFAADLAQLAANVAAPVPSSAVPSSPMRGAVGSSAASTAAAASPLRPRLARRNALTPNSRRELRMMMQLPVSPAPSPMASPLAAPSMTRSISASFTLRATPDSEHSAASATETPLQSRRGSVVSASTDETHGSPAVFSPRASAMMSFFGSSTGAGAAAASPRAESPSMHDVDSFLPPRVRNLERRRAIINHSEFFATIPEQWQASAVPAPTSPRIRARRPSSPFIAASAAAGAGSRSIFQVLTSIPPMTLTAVDPNSSPIEGAMDGAFLSPMWSPSQ